MYCLGHTLKRNDDSIAEKALFERHKTPEEREIGRQRTYLKEI